MSCLFQTDVNGKLGGGMCAIFVVPAHVVLIPAPRLPCAAKEAAPQRKGSLLQCARLLQGPEVLKKSGNQLLL